MVRWGGLGCLFQVAICQQTETEFAKVNLDLKAFAFCSKHSKLIKFGLLIVTKHENENYKLTMAEHMNIFCQKKVSKFPSILSTEKKLSGHINRVINEKNWC